MKTRKNIYFTIGIFLIMINLLADIADFKYILSQIQQSKSGIGYFIGSQLFLLFGLVFLRLGFKMKRKLENQQMKKMIDEIGT